MKKLLIIIMLIISVNIAKAQDDQLYIGIYRMSNANATLKTGDVAFKANNLIFKIDWLAGNSGWVAGDFSLVPNIDWGGTVEAPETVHGAWAEVDFGFYLNQKKPIKILNSKTFIGIGAIGGFKSAGFSTGGITFPGASLSALTKVGQKVTINTKYHYSFFFNNTDSEYTARNIKLAFDCSYKLTQKLGITVTPNFNSFTTENSQGALLKGTYKSVDFGVSLFW